MSAGQPAERNGALRRDVVRLSDRTGGRGPFFARHDRYSLLRTTEIYFKRDYWEVIAIVRGSAINRVRDRTGGVHVEQLAAGQLHLWRPQDVHMIMPTDLDGISYLQVGFPSPEWLSFARLAGADEAWMTAEEPPHALFDPDDAGVVGAFEDAIASFGHGGTMLDLIRFWTVALPPFLARSTCHPDDTVPHWLTVAIDLMRDDANLSGGLPRMLELTHVSQRHLSRMVGRFFGTTPSQLLLDLRLRRSEELLATTDDPVGAVAHRVGFTDHAYFSNSFRRLHAMSPSEYRGRRAAVAG